MNAVPAGAFGYHPGLDGLRGVAILAVMIYHSGLGRGGYLGVDVFFALSGFLITTLLLEEHAATGTIAFRKFYARWALRLLPALVVFLAVWLAVLYATLEPRFWAFVTAFGLSVLFYVANWVGIWVLPLGVFGHTWSLSIEEQFYVLWPIVVLVLARSRMPPRWIAAGLVLLAAASLLWRWELFTHGASERRIYFATDTHADGLMLGAALAFAVRSGRPLCGRGTGGVGGLAATTLLAAIAILPFQWFGFGTSAIAAVATLAVILDTLRPGSRLARVLATRWLVGTGRISYGLYLWHFPVFFYLGALKYPGELAPAWRTMLAWAATFAVSLASYYVIERRALALKSRFSWTAVAGQRNRGSSSVAVSST